MAKTASGSAVRTALIVASLSIAPLPAQLWESGNRLLLPTSGDQASAEYGHTLAVGDFNGDGLDDLAVAAPFRDVPQIMLDDAGEVEIFLAQPGRTFVSSLRVVGGQDGEYFGWALATGDFDGDGDDELAIGAPRADAGADLSGEVRVMDFGDSGWTSQGIFSQGLNGLPGTPEIDDEFGFALAVGDFNADTYDDLAVGVPLEDITGSEEGAVEILYGSDTGLVASGGVIFVAGQDGVLGTRGDGDTFGWALAAADFDRDGKDDLAIGAPRRTVGAATLAGQVHILRGSAAGLTATGDQLFDAAGDPDAGGARFGNALAAGDFNYPGFSICFITSDCAPDLAIGSPEHTLSAHSAAGQLTLLFASPGSGLSTTGALVLDQGDVGEQVETGDEFGGVLASGHLDRGSFLLDAHSAADLLVGVPFEGTATGAAVGVAHLLFGGGSGPSTFGLQKLAVHAGLGAAPAQAQDKFGAALAAGDFDGDGWGDLAVGLSRRDRPGQQAAGAVQVQFGALFADGFGSEATCGWLPAGCP